MEAATLARPYARAAFELAQDSHALSEWSAHLATAAAMASDPRLDSLGNDPRVEPQQLAAILRPDGVTEDAPFARFLAVMSEHRRLSLLPEVSDLFDAMRREAEHVLKVRLSCAEQPQPAQIEALLKALETRYQSKINLDVDVHSDMIGGAILDVDGHVIDASLRTRLHQLQTALTR
ncbi:MAG: F0F1 ATP synthase subunit delta [Xanthomonadales bacterium]|nr:F0F1 ATP synthase subunit delta [Xanthomonadales bacterium]